MEGGVEMKLIINNELIRGLEPCYNPSRYVKDEAETLPVLEWVAKYRGIVPDKDIIWLLCHEEFLSDKNLRLFAVWCARKTLKLVKNPDSRSVEACNVAELYANDEATDEELKAACSTAYDAASRDAVYHAAYWAAYPVAADAAARAARATIYVADQLDKLLTYFK